jgi:glucokinase
MVFQAAEQGDPACLQAIQAAVRHLAAGIANVICLLDPDIIAIGGGLTRTEIRLDEMVSAEIEKILPRMLQNRVKIRIAQNHGDETLLGAALLTEIG